MDVRLLGHLEVSDSGGSEMAVAGKRQRGLLGTLATFHPQPVTKDRRIEELWPDPSKHRECWLRVRPGRHFGELAALLGTVRMTSVRATAATRLSAHSVATFRHRLGAECWRAARATGRPGNGSSLRPHQAPGWTS